MTKPLDISSQIASLEEAIEKAKSEPRVYTVEFLALIRSSKVLLEFINKKEANDELAGIAAVGLKLFEQALVIEKINRLKVLMDID